MLQFSCKQPDFS